jgi:TPP-dependent pyruvate/acetoin dehydrogenase alpha subunit
MEIMGASELIAFESMIASKFNSGEIRAPIHLSDGNESQLISIFKEVKESDWVFSSWRSHYHCLLKGVPPNELEAEIMAGRSISLCFPKYRVFTSAIVAGQVSQAVGVALAIKRAGGLEKVWCFIGDMTSETGTAQSSITYSRNHNLPIVFVVEDNGNSVLTNTRQIWGSDLLRYEKLDGFNLLSYKYNNSYPHAGAGKRVQF